MHIYHSVIIVWLSFTFHRAQYLFFIGGTGHRDFPCVLGSLHSLHQDHSGGVAFISACSSKWTCSQQSMQVKLSFSFHRNSFFLATSLPDLHQQLGPKQSFGKHCSFPQVREWAPQWDYSSFISGLRAQLSFLDHTPSTPATCPNLPYSPLWCLELVPVPSLTRHKGFRISSSIS